MWIIPHHTTDDCLLQSLLKGRGVDLIKWNILSSTDTTKLNDMLVCALREDLKKKKNSPEGRKKRNHTNNQCRYNKEELYNGASVSDLCFY